MATTEQAYINHDILAWARKTINYDIDIAAKRIKVDVEKLLSWERGEDLPSISQLRRISTIYKRPVSIFFLSEVPAEDIVFTDYRKIHGENIYDNSPQLNIQIRQARYKRAMAIDLSELLSINIPEIGFKLSQHIGNFDEVAKEIRTFLNANIRDQIKVTDQYESLKYWKKIIEDTGILVFHTSIHYPVDINEMRGISLNFRPFPIILLNSKDAPYGRIFTLLHELTHILLQDSGLCDLDEHNNNSVEVFCNKIAASILVPKDKFFEYAGPENETKAWTEAEIDNLSKTFSVSKEVIVRRLLTFNKTTKEFYKEKRAEYLNKYLKPSGHPPVHRMAISTNGYKFTSMVMDAYSQHIISQSDIASYLGVKTKHIPKIEHELYKAHEV